MDAGEYTRLVSNMSQKSTNSSSRFLNFTTEEDAVLIETVEQNRALYDLFDKDYKDMFVRSQLWLDVAVKMGKSVPDCKKRWRSIKDTYYRQKRIKRRSNWIWIERLRFLDSVGDRPGGVTFDHQDDNSVSNEEEMQLADDNNCAQPNNTSAKISTLKVPDDVDSRDPDSASDPKNRSLQAEDVINLIDRCNREKRGEDILADPLFAFFHSMALVVKKLPPELIAEARVKVCAVVGNLEVKALRDGTHREYHNVADKTVKVEVIHEPILQDDIQ